MCQHSQQMAQVSAMTAVCRQDMVPSSGTHPQPFAHHAGEDEGHDLVQVGLQLYCPIAHQATQCLYIHTNPH